MFSPILTSIISSDILSQRNSFLFSPSKFDLGKTYLHILESALDYIRPTHFFNQHHREFAFRQTKKISFISQCILEVIKSSHL